MNTLTRMILFLQLTCMAVCAGQTAVGIRVIESDAIPYTRFLSKADFDTRFPGVVKSSSAELDTGWYVVYQHESLSYYFGPILLESTGKDYLSQLESTMDAVVAKRPTITGYRLELSFEPSESSSSESDSASAEQIESVESVYSSSTPPTPPEPSVWSFVRKLFGF